MSFVFSYSIVGTMIGLFLSARKKQEYENSRLKTIGYVCKDKAKALANYPHARRAGDFIFISGISSRLPNGTHIGVTQKKDGTFILNIESQTRAVLENIASILKNIGASLENLATVTIFLVDFKDYAGMNKVYNEFFNSQNGPTRTTVAVARLPHPNLLIEIQSTAYCPI